MTIFQIIMLSKIQKIWLWIFGGMFIVPEVIWSPVINLIYNLLQNSNNAKILRPNFLTDTDNLYILLYVLCIQFIGILGSAIIITRGKMSFKFKILLVLPMLVLLLITGLILYIAFSLRRGIGF